jgi:hypothetical protein
MLSSRRLWLSIATVGVFGLSSVIVTNTSVSAQEITYQCARRNDVLPVRVCVGQMISLGRSSEPARVTRITDSYLELDGHAQITIWNLGQDGVSVGAPPDSYLQTCDNVSVDGMDLYARCRRMNGDWINTSINFYSCTADGVWNNDGSLTCNRE